VKWEKGIRRWTDKFGKRKDKRQKLKGKKKEVVTKICNKNLKKHCHSEEWNDEESPRSLQYHKIYKINLKKSSNPNFPS